MTKVFTNVGAVGTQMGGSISTPNQSDMTVSLVNKLDREISTDELCAVIRTRLDSIPGIRFSMKPTNITGNNQPQIQIAVTGADMDELWAAAKRVHEIVKTTPGADYVEYSTKSVKTEIEIIINRDKIAEDGIECTCRWYGHPARIQR